MKSKLWDQGIKAIFLSYAANHAKNVYWMQNLETKKVLFTRWLDQIQDKDACGEDTYHHDDEDIQIQPTEETQEVHVQDPPEEEKEEVESIAQANQEPQRPARLSRAVRALQLYNRPKRLKSEGETNQFCFFVSKETSNYDKKPTTLQEAWHHNDLKKREKWRETIRLEFRQMGKNTVWQKECLKHLPQNKKGIGANWVFNGKKNEVFSTRLVVKGND